LEVLTGHEFIRANKDNQFSAALAAEGRSLSVFLADFFRKLSSPLLHLPPPIRENSVGPMPYFTPR
jgi:hypothetical protein